MNLPGKPAKKYSQAARLHDTIRLIESRHGISIDELAEDTGVNRRTIHRDLNAIAAAGYPLTGEWQGDRKLYRFVTGYKSIQPITFSIEELVTLYFLRSNLESLDGTLFHDDLVAIFRKIGSVLPPRFAANLERISQITLPIVQGRRDYSKFSAIISTLRNALVYQKSVELHYRVPSRKSSETYLVNPYSFIFYKGGLYVQGFARNRGGGRIFAIERLTSVEITAERFEMPADYIPETEFKQSFGIVNEDPLEIVLLFSKEIAHSISDRIWHRTQRIRRLADGRIQLSFLAGGKMEIISWILSFGEHAEVVSPVELRQEIAAKASSMVALYGEVPDE